SLKSAATVDVAPDPTGRARAPARPPVPPSSTLAVDVDAQATTRSAAASALTLATAAKLAPPPVAIGRPVAGNVRPGPGDSVATLPVSATRSVPPSPSKSPAATSCGVPATVKVDAAPNVPFAVPKNTETLDAPLATARSRLPSWSRSAATMPRLLVDTASDS